MRYILIYKTISTDFVTKFGLTKIVTLKYIFPYLQNRWYDNRYYSIKKLQLFVYNTALEYPLIYPFT